MRVFDHLAECLKDNVEPILDVTSLDAWNVMLESTERNLQDQDFGHFKYFKYEPLVPPL